MTRLWQTEKETSAQPGIWRNWARELPDIAVEIRDWIRCRRRTEILLCGAGTSAFIGDSIAGDLNGLDDRVLVRNIPTTDIVPRPGHYLRPGMRTLVVSFGRSGNSSETIGTLNLLDRHAAQADRLHITCGRGSALETHAHPGPGELRVVMLPRACYDSGFAMTSSFTTMLLTAVACLGQDHPSKIVRTLNQLADGAEQILEQPLGLTLPKRVVFLGSGPFLGTARESALKVLELTAGQLVSSWDSTMGFRHGPKAVVNDDTAIFIYISSDPLARKYDLDCSEELRNQFPNSSIIAIGEQASDTDFIDLPIQGCGEDVWNAALFVVYAQRLAIAWSKSFGLNVDDPFGGKILTRVVSDVTLHV